LLENGLKFIAPPLQVSPGGIPLSKRAQRRLAHTSVIHDGPMVHRDGKTRHVTWLRFDIGRFLDRSKY